MKLSWKNVFKIKQKNTIVYTKMTDIKGVKKIAALDWDIKR